MFPGQERQIQEVLTAREREQRYKASKALAEDLSKLWVRLKEQQANTIISSEAYEGYRRIVKRVCLNNKGSITISDPELARP